MCGSIWQTEKTKIMQMKIPTEPIGSIPRPIELILGMQAYAQGQMDEKGLQELYDSALRDTIRKFELTGSPVITDGEQTKPSFATYPIAGMKNLLPQGVVIPFADGHTRQLPVISEGPFRYMAHASAYLKKAKQYTRLPVKQAVISVSALSLLYPQQGLPGYTQEHFIEDLIGEAEADIRQCIEEGAYNVQIDFTEARLSLKLDPSGGILNSFIALNNQVLDRFTQSQRKNIGVHSCPGGDHDSTHSADIAYADLLPSLFELHAGNFYLEFAAEKDKQSVLKSIKENLRPGQRVFLGVTNVLDRRIESAAQINELIQEALAYIPLEQFGTTDDCGFSPFADDVSTSREIAFAKIRSRIEGTKMAEAALEQKKVFV
jgi:5-methyltetrahydropteroyltriglutamate--homocysteine methyltransferase